jgi:HEAT repeat protein
MLQINNTAVESGLARHSSLKAFGLSEGDLDRLLDGLAKTDVLSRRAIRSSVRELGEAAVVGLAKRLSSDDVNVRRGAADLLRQLPGTESAIAALARAIADEDWLVRLWAVDAVGRLYSAGRPAIESLKQALHDPVPHVRTAAFIAVCKVRGG